MFCLLVRTGMFSSTSKTGSRAWAMVFLFGVALIAKTVSIQMICSNVNQFHSVVGTAGPAVPIVTFEVLVATRDLPIGTLLLANESRGSRRPSRRTLLRGPSRRNLT